MRRRRVRLTDERLTLLLAARPPVDSPDTFLNIYCPTVLGFRIPDWHMCEDHNTPADFTRAMLLRKDGRYVFSVILWVAGRAGSKSFQLALCTWAKARTWDGYDARILGGSGEQARQCYDHTLEFWDAHPLFLGEVADVPHIERTQLKNKSHYSILTCSMKSVRGKHPQQLNIDEADEVPRDIFDAAWSQSFKRTKGRGAGIAPQWVVTSTINYAGGLVEGLLRTGKDAGWHIGVHCWREVAQTCNDLSCAECNLRRSCQGILRDQMRDCEIMDQTGKWVEVCYDWKGETRRTYVESAKIDDTRRTPWAIGHGVKIRGNPHGYMDIENIRNVRRGVSDEAWDSEWDCNLRQLRGAVLRRADVERCMADVQWEERMPYTWVGADWGYVNETCELIFQWDGAKELHVVAEVSWTERSDEELRILTNAIGDRYRTRELWGDAEHPGIFKVLRNDGWDAKKVAFGAYKELCIEQMRVWMQGHDGRVLKINKRLTHLHDCLVNWHYKPNTLVEEIDKKDDHPCDAFVAGMRRFTRDPKLKPLYHTRKNDAVYPIINS